VSLDEAFMKVALEEALIAFSKDEVPVGAVLVYNGEVIARAHNQVEALQDASAHAELLCLKKGAKILKNWRLLKTTLYTTLEPCSMCVGALLLFRVEAVVWGAPDLRHGAGGSWVDLLSKEHPTHNLRIRSGVLADESARMMKEFFQNKRK
jgi:tRNA(adenine34) deaminase